MKVEENAVKNENIKKKKYLGEYKRHTRRAKKIESELEEIRDMKMNPSVNNDGMPHGSDKNDLSGYVAELDKKENELYIEGVERIKKYKDISYRINKLKDEDERDVLFYRYIKCKEFWEIANEMGYSERWIYELHGRALAHFEIEKK